MNPDDILKMLKDGSITELESLEKMVAEEAEKQVNKQWEETKALRISFMGVLGCKFTDIMNEMVHLDEDDPAFYDLLMKMKVILEVRSKLEKTTR